MKRSRGMTIFYLVLVVNVILWIACIALLRYWSEIVWELAASGKSIPGFFDSSRLLTIVTAGLTTLGTTAGTLLVRYGAREATGNLGHVNLSTTAAKKVQENEKC